MIVVKDELTDEVNLLLKRISNDTPQVITGFHGEAVTILDQEDIIRIYAENGKVFADTENGGYCIRLRLYELEERLNRNPVSGAFITSSIHSFLQFYMD